MLGEKAWLVQWALLGKPKVISLEMMLSLPEIPWETAMWFRTPRSCHNTYYTLYLRFSTLRPVYWAACEVEQRIHTIWSTNTKRVLAPVQEMIRQHAKEHLGWNP